MRTKYFHSYTNNADNIEVYFGEVDKINLLISYLFWNIYIKYV